MAFAIILIAISQMSIVPPPFGSGYHCRVSNLRQVWQYVNRAAPFRERLLCKQKQDEAEEAICQSCRPLSGAVTRRQRNDAPAGAVMSIVPPPFGSGYPHLRRRRPTPQSMSIVPPPFGSGYPADVPATRRRPDDVNRAAPFRERLPQSLGAARCGRMTDVNRAAPFRERLPAATKLSHAGTPPCQSCRPLSGAVTDQRLELPRQHLDMSIVPPPFGSGYRGDTPALSGNHRDVNRAAPFRERLRVPPLCFAVPSGSMSIVPPPFGSGYLTTCLTKCAPPLDVNRAAPFRERLPNSPVSDSVTSGKMSIVPPPFGSGYPRNARTKRWTPKGCQSCRPLSGAVSLIWQWNPS